MRRTARHEFEGDDLQAALHAASESMGIAEPDLDYEIVEQGRRGLFGIGARRVRIRIMPPVESDAGRPAAGPRRKRSRSRPGRREGSSEAPRDRDDSASAERDQAGSAAASTSRDKDKDASAATARDGTGAAASGEGRRPKRRSRRPRSRGDRQRSRGKRDDAQASPRPEPRERPRNTEPLTGEMLEAHSTVQRMIKLLELDVTVDGSADESGLELFLEGPDVRRFNQKGGELLGAFQFLLNRMCRRAWPEVGRVRLSCDGQQRKRRDDDLVELTREVAQQVVQTGEAKKLHPMNAYERRLVHLTTREFEGVGSTSEGDGTMKIVRIYKTESQPDAPPPQ